MKARTAIAHLGNPDDGFSIEVVETTGSLAVFFIRKWDGGECTDVLIEVDTFQEMEIEDSQAKVLQFPNVS